MITEEQQLAACEISRALVTQDIESIEHELLKYDQAECPVIHRFGVGIYIREIHLPAGTIAIGHHQNFEHNNIFLKGKILMLNDDGSSYIIEAPMSFVGQPGRKAGFIIDDVVWLNIYATDEQDIDTLERTYITKSKTWLNDEQQRTIDILDYKSAIMELGFDEATVQEQVKNTEDMCELPHGAYKIKVGDSDLAGNGLFATAKIMPGEVIAPARIDGKRTIAGRYTNHSLNPNAQYIVSGHDLYLIAIKEINGCKGGQNGDEITIDYRVGYKTNMESLQ